MASGRLHKSACGASSPLALAGWPGGLIARARTRGSRRHFLSIGICQRGFGVQAAATDGERLAHRPASRGAKKGFGSLRFVSAVCKKMKG